MIDYILENKEWIFSGIGLFALTGIVALLRHLFVSKSQEMSDSQGMKKEQIVPTETPDSPDPWAAITPPKSKYKTVSKETAEIPCGPQLFSFEFAPDGHARALNLNGQEVRVEIQFICRLVNAGKALFGAGEYALNLLQPRFLVLARSVLEKHTIDQLRGGRPQVEEGIKELVAPEFEELGFKLESVSIGAIEEIN